MDSWAKKLVETVWVDEKDSPIITYVKDLLHVTDKDLYLQARDK